ncbi:hypothetical protein [Jannaschia marina]|uniref:hypothetical protein n=1 Tax=Jannaschia marina TaxID=2741674 RepID=UPI0015CA9F4E|nr:hypothetical protein [Jannaschia marina]
MARKKKPVVQGKDPAYDHQFSRYRKAPSNMPDDVVIPGLTKEAPTQPEKTETTPRPEPATKAAEAPTVTSEAKPNTAPKPAPPSKKKTAPMQRHKEETRLVSLIAGVKQSQADAMQPLLDRGLDRKHIIALAGRRTTASFEPTQQFKQVPEADRRPMREAYRTTKTVPTKLIEKLRKEHDPLGVMSDGAMLRGQFETRFWSNLDAVIAELTEKYC